MDLIPLVDDNEVIFFSSSKDCPEILEIWVTKGGELFAKITCPKDKVTTVTLGKVDLPPEIRRIGKKAFRSESTKWIISQMNKSFPILKFGAGDSYYLSFKLNGRSFERRGKFRG
jgi:hypothetical protein